MTEQPGLDLSPFFFAGGPVGCLLLHGFTGAPPEVRPMGEYLAERGLTVLGPCLPGHATTPDDLIRTHWTDWAGEAERGLHELQRQCQRVFVAGLSMGGLLTLYLGARYPVAGLIPMAAAVHVSSRRAKLAPFLKYFVKQIKKGPPEKGDWVDPQAIRRHWSYNVYPVAPAHELLKLQNLVRSELHRISAPILIIQGLRDAAVPPASAQWLYDNVPSCDKRLLLLANSGHCLTIDAERETVWRAAYDFIQAHI